MYDIIQVIGMDLSIIPHTKHIYTTVEHDSLKIWANTNSWYWFSKSVGGGVNEWLEFYHGLEKHQTSEYLESFGEAVSDESILKFLLGHEEHGSPVETKHIYGRRVYHPYIKSRNITEETAKKYELEVSNNHILIPVKDQSNERVGAILRNIKPLSDKDRYKKYTVSQFPALWNLQRLEEANPNDIILLFEGAWSVMRFDQVINEYEDKLDYEGTIRYFAILGRSVSDDLLGYLNRFTNVFFILDNDGPGREVARQLRRLNPLWKSVIPSKYPDELSDEQILKFLDKAKDIPVIRRDNASL